MAALAVVLLAIVGVFAGKLVVVQAVDGPTLAQQARDARLSTVSVIGSRGQITDATGVVLAGSVTRFDISVNQRLIPRFKGGDGVPAGAAGVAQTLAPLLGMDPAELGGKLVGTSAYKYLKKGVLPTDARQIAALRINGINVEQTAERVYPNGTLAGDIIGFTNSNGQGLQGLESALNSRLTGTSGTLTYERGGNGQAIPGGYRSGEAATDGSSVQLTIRDDVQWKAQDSIERAVKESGASSAEIVVMRPDGEVLAIADSSTIDPNKPGAGSDGALLSAVSDVFEPGSTGKVVTMAAALETGTVTPTSQFEVPSTYAIGAQVFHDSHDHALEHLTTTGVLAESSNVGTVQIGQKMSAQTQYDYMSKFGFGSSTGIEVPGESAGILHPVDQWDGRTRYNVLFGQGVSVTALQAASVYATIANGGVRVAPHLVKGWTAPDGTFTPSTTAASTQVVSPQTAATVTTMLESVVDDGTGGAAAVNGYRVAGKTGTAQDIATNGITASFIGFAPADNPQVVVAVVLKNPKTSIYGGVVAAPVFSEVTSYTLTVLGAAPSGAPATLFPTTW